jgi:hypothetical protein
VGKKVTLTPRWATMHDQPPQGHRWSWWPTPYGEMFVDQQLAWRASSGVTRLTGPVEATLDVAALQDGYGRFLRDGVALTLAGRSGQLVRDSYGLRSSSRTMRVDLGARQWTVAASLRRLELRRARELVAVNAGNEPSLSQLTTAADLEDAAVTVLLTVNGLWDGAALWSRYLARNA